MQTSFGFLQQNKVNKSFWSLLSTAYIHPSKLLTLILWTKSQASLSVRNREEIENFHNDQLFHSSSNLLVKNFKVCRKSWIVTTFFTDRSTSSLFAFTVSQHFANKIQIFQLFKSFCHSSLSCIFISLSNANIFIFSSRESQMLPRWGYDWEKFDK